MNLKFSPDQTVVHHSITIVTDDVLEEDETFTLSLSEKNDRVSIATNCSQAVVAIMEVVGKYLMMMMMVYMLCHVHMS